MDHDKHTAAFITTAKHLDADGILAALASWRLSEAEFIHLSESDKATLASHTPYCGLVDIYSASPLLRTSRSRHPTNPHDDIAHHLITLANNERRETGDTSIAEDLDDFDENWAFFTEGCLERISHWNNIVVAGGAIQACLAPIPDNIKLNPNLLLNHFRTGVYEDSDIDIYMWGLNEAQTENRTRQLIRDLFTTIPILKVVRTTSSVTLFPPKHYRPIQIIQKPFQSPTDILASFDLDACNCLFDGTNVYLSPRGIAAHMCQLNELNPNRACATYAVRLAKYALRSFEISAPMLDRSMVYDDDNADDCMLGLLLDMEKSIESCTNIADQIKVIQQYSKHYVANTYDTLFA